MKYAPSRLICVGVRAGVCALLSLLVSACQLNHALGPEVVAEESELVALSSSVEAHLYLPNTRPPYPLVIDLHGCNGIWARRNNQWLPFFLDQGIAVMQVDSFTQRGVSNVCENVYRVSPMERTLDVAEAIRFVRRDARFDAERLFLIGASHGGTTALLTNLHDSAVFSSLRGVIAYYPYCLDTLPVLNADLLILIGMEDDWTPAHRCADMKVAQRRGHRFEVHRYPQAHHSFDIPGLNEVYAGHRVRYNAKATQESMKKVRAWVQ